MGANSSVDLVGRNCPSQQTRTWGIAPTYRMKVSCAVTKCGSIGTETLRKAAKWRRAGVWSGKNGPGKYPGHR